MAAFDPMDIDEPPDAAAIVFEVMDIDQPTARSGYRLWCNG